MERALLCHTAGVATENEPWQANDADTWSWNYSPTECY